MFLKHLARINESDTKLKKICAKEGNSINNITNRFQHKGGHLKCNKALISDDQTNNYEI